MSEMVQNELQDDLNGKFMTFFVGDAIYGIELMHVIEIVQMSTITKVPNVPPYISGIINLRGKIVPVINVRTKFCQPEKEFDEKTCIIVIEIEGMRVGLIVDSFSDVATIENHQLADPPTSSTSAPDWLFPHLASSSVPPGT